MRHSLISYDQLYSRKVLTPKKARAVENVMIFTGALKKIPFIKQIPADVTQSSLITFPNFKPYRIIKKPLPQMMIWEITLKFDIFVGYLLFYLKIYLDKFLNKLFMLTQHTYRVKFNIGSVINIDIRGFAQFQRNRMYYTQFGMKLLCKS